MKTMILAAFLLSALPLAAGAAEGETSHSIRFHLDTKDPLAHVGELIRTARALERVTGAGTVEVVAARGDLEVHLAADSTLGSPDLVRVVEAEGFHASETTFVANR